MYDKGYIRKIIIRNLTKSGEVNIKTGQSLSELLSVLKRIAKASEQQADIAKLTYMRGRFSKK